MADVEDQEPVISEGKIESDPETRDQRLDLESSTIHELLNKPVPGMWLYPVNQDHCCIYRVPHIIRQVNPEAYTPQLVIIGPLHRSLISQALKSHGDITNTKLMSYLNMERHKKVYLRDFAQRFDDDQTISELRRIIEAEEEFIRECYSESTAWIKSREFVDMILHDSVFIMEFIYKTFEQPWHYIGDILIDEPCLQSTVYDDIFLLENQLPFFILESLFNPIIPRHFMGHTFKTLFIKYFGYEGKIDERSTFKHFTDLSRLFSVENLTKLSGSEGPMQRSVIEEGEHIYNADKLDRAGVKFKVLDGTLSKQLDVKFNKGCLEMGCLTIDDKAEIRIRNLMALEQCHYPYDAHVCQYILFLDRLIDTHKDVEILVDNGIITNWIGENSLVAEMLNKLNFGIIYANNNYYGIAKEVNEYYRNPFNRARNILKRVYFSNVWTGTATVAATFLLLMTLIQTVISIIQTIKK